MQKMSKLASAGLLISFLLLMFNSLFAQEKEIKAELPVLITSCGQSGGPPMFKFIMKKLKIEFDYVLEATAADLVMKKKEKIPYKSIIVVTGASLKGMGAAGISIEDEIERAKELIAEAKKQKILIIGAHVEGMKRRAQGAAPGDNSDELSIDAVCPVSDILIIKKEGDSDGRFTIISKNKNIPMLLFEKNMEMSQVLKKLFSK